MMGEGRAWMMGRLEHNAAHNKQRHGEINYEAGDVDEGGNKRGGGGSGVSAESLENDREHAAGEGAPEYDAHECDTDGGSEQDAVRTVGMEDHIPKQDAGETDDAKDGAKHKAGLQFTADNAPPVGDGQLAEGHGLDDQGGSLGA